MGDLLDIQPRLLRCFVLLYVTWNMLLCIWLCVSIDPYTIDK